MRFSISDASRRLADDPPVRTDATMHLGDADLIELHNARDLTDSTARLYADVVLRGAMLASEQRKQSLLPETPSPIDATMHLADADLLSIVGSDDLPEVTARLYPEVALRGARLPGKASRSSWLDGSEEPPPDPLGVSQRTVAGRLARVARFGATQARRLFEPGRIPPVRLAAGAFAAGFAAATVLAFVF